MGSDGGLKLKAPVAIRADMRHIFRLVGCRKTPASWCSEPAPRSHARVLLKLCSNRKARLQKEPVPNCDCAGSKAPCQQNKVNFSKRLSKRRHIAVHHKSCPRRQLVSLFNKFKSRLNPKTTSEGCFQRRTTFHNLSSSFVILLWC